MPVAASFSLPQFVSARRAGLLIARSQVRILPGPSICREFRERTSDTADLGVHMTYRFGSGEAVARAGNGIRRSRRLGWYGRHRLIPRFVPTGNAAKWL